MAVLRTMTSLPSPPSPVTPMMKARAGAGAWVIAVAVRPGHLQRSCCHPRHWRRRQGCPLPLQPCWYCPPPTVPPKYVAPFSWTWLPSKTDMPGSTLQAISAAGTPAAQITGLTAPWPSSALLWPAAVKVVIFLVTGVHGHCHYPGKPPLKNSKKS